jgi:hypothetical protein
MTAATSVVSLRRAAGEGLARGSRRTRVIGQFFIAHLHRECDARASPGCRVRRCGTFLRPAFVWLSMSESVSDTPMSTPAWYRRNRAGHPRVGLLRRPSDGRVEVGPGDGGYPVTRSGPPRYATTQSSSESGISRARLACGSGAIHRTAHSAVFSPQPQQEISTQGSETI